MTDVATIIIIGAGNGGLKLAAHLGGEGRKIRLHDVDDSELAEVAHAGRRRYLTTR
jgi:2-polyprenyl-6-methoxyphenol hydroxylase-like FAD-dependent oxidoreductase